MRPNYSFYIEFLRALKHIHDHAPAYGFEVVNNFLLFAEISTRSRASCAMRTAFIFRSADFYANFEFIENFPCYFSFYKYSTCFVCGMLPT